MYRKIDEIVPLGFNCEISFRIEDWFGKVNSYPFSWSYPFNRDIVVDELNNGLKNILSETVSICHDKRIRRMVVCDKTQITFHPKGDFIDKNGIINLEPATIELKSRFAHLRDKFEKLIKDQDKFILFICGLTDNGESSDKDYVLRLYSVLKSICITDHFILLIVADSKRYTDELKLLENDNLKIRMVRKFGNQKRVDFSTDGKNWGKIFAEFLGNKGKAKYTYRLTKRRIIRIFKYALYRLNNLRKK